MSQASQSFFSRWSPAEIMLAVLFLLAPLYYHPNLGGEGLRLPNNSTIWLVAIVFMAYSLNKVIKSETFQLPQYFVFIAAFPVLVIFSGFLSGVEQPLKWLFRVLYIIGGFAFFFSLFQHKLKQGRWDRVLIIIALSGLVHAGVGILQIWLKAEMPYLLPKSLEGIPSGLFQQINNQVTFLVTSIALSFYLASRPILFKRQRWLQLLIVVMVMAASFIVGFSGSRIGFLTLAIAIPILLSVRRKQLKRNKLFSTLLVVVLLGSFTAGMIPSGGRAVDKTVAMQSGYSGSARLGIYDISFHLLKQEPLFGHGIGSFPRVFQYQRPDFYTEHPDGKLPVQMVSHPHNELFQWMVEGGVTALFGIAFVLIGVILALSKCGASRGWSYVALLVPVSLHTQVELPLYMSALHWLILLVLMSMPFVHLSKPLTNGMTIYAQKLSAITVLSFSLIFVVFISHTMIANRDFPEYYKDPYNDKRLSVALVNPYLREQAQWMDMTTILYASIEQGLDHNVEQYISWGKSIMATNPNPELFILMAKAYKYLGQNESYCEDVSLGFAMYPTEQRLWDLVKICKE